MTRTVSKSQPQLNLALPIYYELYYFNEAASKKGRFSTLRPEISAAASAGLQKFNKNYTHMDAQDAYFVAMVLDSRCKALLLERDLSRHGKLHSRAYQRVAGHGLPSIGRNPNPTCVLKASGFQIFEEKKKKMPPSSGRARN